MNLARAVAGWLKHRLLERRLGAVFDKCRAYTMIPRRNFIDTLRVACEATNVCGCVVECGVWRGGMAAGLAAVLGGERCYYLFDSFEGLPDAKEVDGPAAQAWQSNTDSPGYYDNCSAPPEDVVEAMSKTGVSNFKIVRGWFEDTIPNFPFSEPISVLHFDGDWYDSAILCFTHLFDRMAPGGIIIIDDYYVWDGCGRAVHDFLSRRSAVERIRVFGDVCYIRKEQSRNVGDKRSDGNVGIDTDRLLRISE